MKPGLVFTRIWADEDMVELRVAVCDGVSSFASEIYLGHQALKDAVAGLDRFRNHVHGGLFDLRFGEFGPEYASGALDARLHFQHGGTIVITAHMQSQFFDIGPKRVASEATLYLLSEPAMLDEFVRALRAVSDGHRDDATLEALAPPR